MVLIVKLFSIVIIIYGCLIILRPDILGKILEAVKKDNRMQISSGIKISIGLLLILASSGCRTPWIVLFMGALSTFGGVIGLLIKKSTYLQVLDWWIKKPVKYVYLMGALSLAIGALLTLAA